MVGLLEGGEVGALDVFGEAGEGGAGLVEDEDSCGDGGAGEV